MQTTVVREEQFARKLWDENVGDMSVSVGKNVN